MDTTDVNVHVKAMIGELVITICALEAQKAQLVAEKDALVQQLAQAVARSVVTQEET